MPQGGRPTPKLLKTRAMNKAVTIALTLITTSAITHAQDTTTIQMGDKTILIIGDDVDGEDINVDEMLDSLDYEDWDSDCSDDKIAHWGGFEMGVNGFLNSDNGFDMENELYDLDYARSFVFNLHLFEAKLPFFKGHGGLVTGLGFSWHNYQFKGGTNLFTTNDSTWAANDTLFSYDKNKLKMGYIKVPLLLEFNTSLDNDKSFHIAGGVEAGFRIASKTKQKFEYEGETYKTKVKGHYNLNPWKFSAVARIGYGPVTLFANYSLTTLFEKDKGPEIYPFEVGVTLIPF